MATPEEQRAIALGLVNRANQGRTAIDRLRLEIQNRASARRAELEESLRQELQGREGVLGDFMNDKELRPIWDAAVVGDPANGIPPTLDSRAQSDAVNSVNTERVNQGLPSIEGTMADYQRAEQAAQPYRQMVAESQFVETPEEQAAKAEAAEVQSMENASAAFQDQVVRPKAQRNENVINAVEQAMEGGPDGVEAFTKQIESISDQGLRDETIQLAQRAGMEFERPIALVGSDSSVEYPSTEGAYNSPEAVAVREGIKGSAAQFAQVQDAPAPAAAPAAAPATSGQPPAPAGRPGDTSINYGSGSIPERASQARTAVLDYLDGNQDVSAMGMVGDVAKEVGGNLAATGPAIWNMLFNGGAGTLGEEVGKVREGGGSVFDPIANGLAQAFVGTSDRPAFTEEELAAAGVQTPRLMTQPLSPEETARWNAEGRDSDAAFLGLLDEMDANGGARLVPSQPLTDQEAFDLSRPRPVDSTPLTSAELRDVSSRPVQTQPLTYANEASLYSGADRAAQRTLSSDADVSRFIGAESQGLSRGSGLSPAQRALLEEDRKYADSIGRLAR